MGRPTFPVPTEIPDLVTLLNRPGMHWSLAVVEQDQRLYILDGDQVQVVTSEVHEVKAFLYGAFLAAYQGTSLESINDERRGD